MNARTRREHIAALVTTRELGVAELAERFGVTSSTIRRDLAQLAGEGKVLRTLAGAAPQGSEAGYSTRQGQASAAKGAIARAARSFVSDGAIVYLDAGTTCAALAEELVACESVTVVTPSLSVVRALAGRSGVTVELLGGTYRQLSQACYGGAAVEQLGRYVFDVAFTSADEVSLEHGLREESAEQIDLKAAAFRGARGVVVLADSTKFVGEARAGRWIHIPEHATVVSDAAAPTPLPASVAWEYAEPLGGVER